MNLLTVIEGTQYVKIKYNFSSRTSTTLKKTKELRDFGEFFLAHSKVMEGQIRSFLLVSFKHSIMTIFHKEIL